MSVLGGPVSGHYDVAVIGGGISGVQIARHAAGRGLRTILLERNDFGAGTSAATTKAIHGGLRYLEQYDFRVVAESVSERRYLGLAAPHLVQPRSFLLTAYDWSAPRALVLGAGVALYEAMAWRRNVGVPKDIRSPRFRWIGKKALLKQVPWLSPEGLTGAWRHDDTLNIHPERLLLAILKSFVAGGGTALNHAEVTELLRDDTGAVRGVRVNGHQDIAATVTVNAAGPWVASALGDLATTAGVRVRQAKGVHLVTRDLGNRDGVFVRGRNGRHIVVNPWQGKTLVGPTDTPMSGSADEAAAEVEDINLLRETLDSVSATPLVREDVESTIVGVRPLIDDGSDTYTSSRRFEIRDHAAAGLAGLYSVTGGKWTTGRAMGQKVTDTLIKAHHGELPPARDFDSRHLDLSTSFGDYDTVAAAFEAAAARVPTADLPRDIRIHLARLYGTEHEAILQLVAGDPRLATPIPGSSDILAQAVYAVTHEAAETLQDVLDRRLTVGTLGLVQETAARLVAGTIAPLVGWDADRSGAEVAEYLRYQTAETTVLDEAFAPGSSR
ncbi:MAG: glycerol-3-phosphate dehydrogenase/oxidase [Corynebacterium sp.]|uniref:glycerol-3-phosphate dehydrogenase/oxidase n=1 Tax=Corynebacterium sp. TaxID=1720 RepID=UPI0026E068F0|nr:glycerol-3-phosphate dehydrogenase/oxidase [Corynebacterium sp.]MDO5670311.1 glycerol-3-phosphate dehydrogenase/oxidase [Corynebacterium sp.]